MFAALVQGPIVRLVPVGMVFLALQRTFFVEVTVAGVVIQLLTAFAAACGAAGGSESGALAGFILGLMWDLAEGGPLGATSLAMATAGIVAGLLALITVDPQWWLAALFTGVGAAVGELMVPVVRFFIGEDDPFVSRLWVIATVVGVSAMVLSVVLVPLARWCLRIRRADWKAVAQKAEAADAS